MLQVKAPNGNNISAYAMAGLLGISPIEYAQLKHSPVRSVKAEDGKILKYFIVIDHDNPIEIIEKLKMTILRMVYLPLGDI